MVRALSNSPKAWGEGKKQQPVTLVLLGDIAAGKGTQARILARRLELKLIDTGAYSRRLWSGTSRLQKRMVKVKAGGLAPSDIIQKYLERELSNISRFQGVLVDGGKMPAEARLISKLFERQGRKFLVIYLTIPKSAIYERLKIRMQKERRADDSPKAIRNRMDYYRKIYSKTVKFWRGKGGLRKVNGMGRVVEVNSRITKIIKNHF